MPTENDPLAEDEGPCTKCVGGYVEVKPAYALHQYPDPTMDQLAALDHDPAAVAALWAQVETSRQAALNSVYPCRRCNPALFFRWAGGHLVLNHDMVNCQECVEAMGGKRAAARAARAFPDTPTPRRDLQ